MVLQFTGADPESIPRGGGGQLTQYDTDTSAVVRGKVRRGVWEENLEYEVL